MLLVGVVSCRYRLQQQPGADFRRYGEVPGQKPFSSAILRIRFATPGANNGWFRQREFKDTWLRGPTDICQLRDGRLVAVPYLGLNQRGETLVGVSFHYDL